MLESGCEYQDTTKWKSNERHTDRERDEILDHKLDHKCSMKNVEGMETKKCRGQFQ
jgi:hypothetical protein